MSGKPKRKGRPSGKTRRTARSSRHGTGAWRICLHILFAVIGLLLLAALGALLVGGPKETEPPPDAPAPAPDASDTSDPTAEHDRPRTIATQKHVAPVGSPLSAFAILTSSGTQPALVNNSRSSPQAGFLVY